MSQIRTTTAVVLFSSTLKRKYTNKRFEEVPHSHYLRIRFLIRMVNLLPKKYTKFILHWAILSSYRRRKLSLENNGDLQLTMPCLYVIFFSSSRVPVALASKYVEKEVSTAKILKKRIIPCRSSKVKWMDLKWGLDRLQGVQFTSVFDITKGLEALIRLPEGGISLRPSLIRY